MFIMLVTLLDSSCLWRDFVQLGLDTRAVKRTERVFPVAACVLLICQLLRLT
jgi:hypothetical protein